MKCDYLRTVIDNIPNDEIASFFDELKNIYLLWIDAKLSEALESFEKILEEKDLFKFTKKIKEAEVFFKGRVSEQVLTSWDMFHIPFNKRYLIGNQRYSLTGQPMLYIGSSVIDVAEEIEVSCADNLKLSVITFPENDLRIFDLTNNIHDILDNIVTDEFVLEETLKAETKYDKSTFFKMILSSVCSFSKRHELKGFSFCEEYVLPQMLAQILKSKGYNGICYYSTKRYEQVTYSCSEDVENSQEKDSKTENAKTEYSKAESSKMEYKKNIAIFTNIDTEHVYDKSLYNTLSISVPVDKHKIQSITLDDLEELKREINRSKVQEKITQAEKMISSFERNYATMLIDGKKYIETDYGRLHIYEVYTLLNHILAE